MCNIIIMIITTFSISKDILYFICLRKRFSFNIEHVYVLIKIGSAKTDSFTNEFAQADFESTDLDTIKTYETNKHSVHSIFNIELKSSLSYNLQLFDWTSSFKYSCILLLVYSCSFIKVFI